MIKFIYEGKSTELLLACKKANSISNIIVSRLIGIDRINKFKCSNIGSFILAQLIDRSDLVMEIKEYTYRNGNVYGYFDPNQPNVININLNSLPRPTHSLVSTLWHEAVHALDTSTDEYYFNHGTGWFANFYRKWKEECAQFWVDRIAEEVAYGGKISVLTNNTRYKGIPLWKRLLLFWRY